MGHVPEAKKQKTTHCVNVNDGLDHDALGKKTGAKCINGVTLADLEVHVDDPELVAKAVSIYKEHGCVVIRQLNRTYVSGIQEQADKLARHALSQFEKAVEIPEGYRTPDGTLWVPTPKQHQERLGRDKQIMVLGLNYHSSGVLVQCALEPKALDIVEGILGPDIELFGNGQCFYKEPLGGNPKLMHQDSAYFEFEGEGAVGTLNYAVDCSTEINNGPLYVVPGTHKIGGYGSDREGAYVGRKKTFAHIRHVDTRSHLALDPHVWTFDEALPVNGKAGDSVFFHLNCVHGSTPNFSDRPRATFINRYIKAGDRQIIFAVTTKQRAEAEAAYERNEADKFPKQDNGFIVRGVKRVETKFDVSDGKAFH